MWNFDIQSRGCGGRAGEKDLKRSILSFRNAGISRQLWHADFDRQSAALRFSLYIVTNLTVLPGSLSADTNTQCSAGRGTSQQRDWVDEEASILLDDTAMDGKGGLGDIELENLPQLPQMQFPNQGMSMDTSRQSSNSGILSSDTSMGSSSRKTVGHRVRKTGRKPALPRRSYVHLFNFLLVDFLVDIFCG